MLHFETDKLNGEDQDGLLLEILNELFYWSGEHDGVRGKSIVMHYI